MPAAPRRVKLGLEAAAKGAGRMLANGGGTNVTAWRIEATVKLTATVTGFGSTAFTVNQRDYFDPARGVDLYRHSVSSSPQGSVTRDDKLTSLTPKQ